MTRYEAYIDKNWHEHGLAQLVVVRQRDNGSADLGVFLVDVWCLGIKDAIGHSDVAVESVDEMLEAHLPEERREAIHPACAKKLIDGALAYAERLGFAPHRDFRKARKVLSGLEASLCPTEFAFGREGKPCFMRGPDDSDERVDRILAMLEARCGEDGYHFVDAAGLDEADDILDVREDLMDWLDDEPEDVPRFFALSGMVTALQICPQLVMPTRLMAMFWGPEGREWKNQAEARQFAALLMQYWNYVSDLVPAGLAPDATSDDQIIDIWAEDFPEDDKTSILAATHEWASGFMQTTRLWPEAWGDALTRPELAGHWEMLRWWTESGPGNGTRLVAAAEANPPRNIALSVQALGRVLRPTPPAAG